MDDRHQVNSIIAAAICECSGETSEYKIAPEQAKQMAKCIITALSDAGLQIGLNAGSPDALPA
jgi:hypothetical protein